MMPGLTLDETNSALRHAVETRLAAGIVDDGEDCVTTEDLREVRLRGDSLLDEFSQFTSDLPRGAEEWRQLHAELLRLHTEKTRQYGHDESAFANVEASAACGVEPWRRCLCDLSDCVVRMQRYAAGQPVDYENALKDAAMWAMICLVMLRREKRA
jgi:hypothetical protein